MPVAEEVDVDGLGGSAQADPFAFLDPRTPRLRFAIGE
jgi:hypothetical protein